MIREFHQIDLSGRNSFGVGQQAARLAEFETEEDLRTIFSGGVPERWAVLSGGNNILFTRDYDGLLLTPVARQITPLGEEGDTVRVTAGAWADTVGVIQAMNLPKQSLTINVELFGRETPVEISFAEVKKL